MACLCLTWDTLLLAAVGSAIYTGIHISLSPVNTNNQLLEEYDSITYGW